MIDAHNHLHDARLAPWRADFLRELPALGVRRAIVNGTREADWPEVAALAREASWVLPSFGLHPWYVKERSPHWQEALRNHLDANPSGGVGEIGLDRWVKDHDLALQTECFTAQLALAAERNLPTTIHCVQAWGALWEVVRQEPVPERGFLLHAYGGPAEMVPGFVSRGAYFSFSTYFLHERKAAQRAIFAALPADRLLVETDAPDMVPPPGRHDLMAPDGTPLNHPANIEDAYAALAKLRVLPMEALSVLVEENFARFAGIPT
jgi:TatD DNase family protein